MPLITASGPALDVDRKRKLADGLTKVAADVYHLPAEAIIVVVQENPPENVAVGGVLIADRKRKP